MSTASRILATRSAPPRRCSWRSSLSTRSPGSRPSSPGRPRRSHARAAASHPGGPLVLSGHHRGLRHGDDPGRDPLAAGLRSVHHRRRGVHRRTIGDQHRRRHWPGDTGHIAGTGIAYVACSPRSMSITAPTCPCWTACRCSRSAPAPGHRGASHHPAIRRARRPPSRPAPPRTAGTRQAASRNADVCPPGPRARPGRPGSGSSGEARREPPDAMTQLGQGRVEAAGGRRWVPGRGDLTSAPPPAGRVPRGPGRTLSR